MKKLLCCYPLHLKIAAIRHCRSWDVRPKDECCPMSSCKVDAFCHWGLSQGTNSQMRSREVRSIDMTRSSVRLSESHKHSPGPPLTQTSMLSDSEFDEAARVVAAQRDWRYCRSRADKFRLVKAARGSHQDMNSTCFAPCFFIRAAERPGRVAP